MEGGGRVFNYNYNLHFDHFLKDTEHLQSDDRHEFLASFSELLKILN